MEKNEFTKDYLVSRLICMDKEVNGYNKVYYKANENLVDYLDVDFSDKKVFSVLASSDQVFTARLLEAREVDSFDYNRLTLYYYYLRVWTIKYANILYPDILNNNRWLFKLLKLVKPSSEEELRVLQFFKKHVYEGTDLSKLFFDIEKQPEETLLYSSAEELKDCVDQPLNFHHIDLFKPFDLGTTYDILLISNILEWSRGDANKLRIAKENIDRLLSRDGTVICSNLLSRSMEQEQEIFSNYDFNQTGKTYTYKKK